MTATEVDAFLGHFGVKGMQWGVRNKRSTAGMTKQQVKGEKKWEKKIGKTNTFIQVHNRAATLANEIDVPRINNKPKYKDKDFTVDSPLRREYYTEHEQAFNKRMQQAINEIVGPSPMGRTLKVNYDGSTSYVDAKHADEVPPPKLIFDENGYITGWETVAAALAQSGLEFLEHYGVRGMRWGVRRSRSGRPSSSDAKKTSELRKRKPNELTNKQLKTVNERLNLERQFKGFHPGKIAKGHAFAKSVLALGTTAAALYGLTQSPAGKALIRNGANWLAQPKNRRILGYVAKGVDKGLKQNQLSMF